MRRGLVLLLCLFGAAAAGETRMRRAAANGGARAEVRPASRVSLGLELEGNGLFAKAEGAGSGTQGFGFGVGAAFRFPLGRRFQVVLRPGFQYLTLTRSENFSGSITQPLDVTFTQKVGFAALGLYGRFRLVEGRSGLPEWFLGAGTEFLLPVTASQSDSSGDSVSFKSNDKLLLVLLGPSAEFPLSGGLKLSAHVHGLYNVAARSGNRILGVRLGVGAVTAL